MTTPKTSSQGVTAAQAITRHRHTVKLRHLEVKSVRSISPAMTRVTLTGPELDGFISLGFDDHVKMFFPAPGKTTPVLPTVGPDGLEMPKGGEPLIARDYTPRRYDPQTGELEIDFALNHQGPACDWARSLQPGDGAWIAGPRGSFVISPDFDWHLLIADETGLPALARRLEELPSTARVLALIEIEGAKDEIALQAPQNTQLIWCHRGTESAGSSDCLLSSLKEVTLPEGDYFTWIACESGIAKALRSFLITNCSSNPKQIRAFGYWRTGATAIHEHFES